MLLLVVRLFHITPDDEPFGIFEEGIVLATEISRDASVLGTLPHRFRSRLEIYRHCGTLRHENRDAESRQARGGGQNDQYAFEEFTQPHWPSHSRGDGPPWQQ